MLLLIHLFEYPLMDQNWKSKTNLPRELCSHYETDFYMLQWVENLEMPVKSAK